MKRIEMNIEKCEQCPFLLLDHKNMISGCYNTERGIWVIDDISLIPDWCPLPDVDGLTAERELLIEEYKNLQKEIKDCHELLNIMCVPTNGIDLLGCAGEGKRQNLSLHQRISFLKYFPDETT